jgi:endonuclease/exonuclease/phosphatase family metal-dependent hydrolase
MAARALDRVLDRFLGGEPGSRPSIGPAAGTREFVHGETRYDGELLVMSFNIRGARRRDGENAWERRARLNARVILQYGPDLIGFQELQRENARFYEKHLPGYERVLGPRYENRKPHAFNAIYWNPQRLRLLGKHGFWLSETPEEFSRSWDTAQVRSANLLRFRPLPDGPDFVHLNTHLDHKSVPARRRGARLIVDRLNASWGSLPTLVTGDFNAEPVSPVHRAFADTGFADAHLILGNPPTRTFHRFRGEGFNPKRKDREWRIDWVLVRDGASAGWDTRYCGIVRDCEPPLYPSDHYPVLARLALAPK